MACDIGDNMGDKHKFDKVEYEGKEKKKKDEDKEKDDAKVEEKKNDLKGLQQRVERIERIMDL